MVRLPATQASVTVVVATPFASVMVGVALIASAPDGDDAKVQATGCPAMGLPFLSTIVALTVSGTPHLSVPVGGVTVTAPATSPA